MTKDGALLRSNSTILVTGGARGIAAQCAIRMAEAVGCTCILIGRSANDQPEPEWANGVRDETELKRRIMQHLTSQGEKPTPKSIRNVYHQIVAQREISHTLEAIQRAGGKAIYVRADVTDANRLRAALAGVLEQHAPVSGVIHAAGNLADKLIENKTETDFEVVYAPKVDGLRNLLECLPVEQLEFVVLFSSIIGFFGNAGQTDYAIANETLNKTAYRLKRRYPHLEVTAMDWGPWESGMVTPELRKFFEAQNVQLIPLQQGGQKLVDLLTAGRTLPPQLIVGGFPPRPAVGLADKPTSRLVRRKLTPEANPFLMDHVIGASAVLPATCAAAWLVHLAEQLYPGYYCSEMQDYRVLKGIVFDDTFVEDYTLEMSETSDRQGEQILLSTRISSKNQKGTTRYHYSAALTLTAAPPPPPHLLLQDDGIDRSANVIDGAELYRNGTLFHGRDFQGVQRLLALSPEGLTMDCRLPALEEHRQGQFPVQRINPFLYDAVVQSLLIWTQMILQAPCLPSRLEKLELYQPLDFDRRYRAHMTIRSRTETTVTGDITVQDGDGNVCVRFIGLEGTISKRLNLILADGNRIQKAG